MGWDFGSTKLQPSIKTLQKENEYNRQRSSVPPILNGLQKKSHERWLTSLGRPPDNFPESTPYCDGSSAIKRRLRVYPTSVTTQTKSRQWVGYLSSQNAPRQMRALDFGLKTSVRSCSSAERLCPGSKARLQTRISSRPSGLRPQVLVRKLFAGLWGLT